MQLQEIVALQRDFDLRHASRFEWAEPVESAPDTILQFLLVALLGEMGEMANVVKKVARGDCTFDDARSAIRSELADVFIYVLKMAHQADIDLEDAFLEKLKRNELRFRPFERSNPDAKFAGLPFSLDTLSEAKYLPPEQLKAFLYDFCRTLPSDPDLGTRLAHLTDQDWSEAKEGTFKLHALTALVLADAVSTEDPIARERWVHEIEEFCNNAGIGFEGVRALASRSLDTREVVLRYITKRESLNSDIRNRRP